jgi:outer membrane lipoprotein-sorting protein
MIAKSIKWMVPLVLLLLPTIFVVQSRAGEPRPSAQELLKVSDRARGGLAGGLVWDIEIQSREDGEATDRSFHVKARGDDALAIATSPARNKGELFLFNDRTMWFFKPGLRKPVAISARQKLTGQAANGDIASTHYSRDYDGVIVREETFGGGNAYVLELKAKNKNVTYDQIRYWIGETSRLGLKAEFLSLEGKLLKTATFVYGNTVKVDGNTFAFVSQMTITDAKLADNRSTISYQQPQPEEIPPTVFNVNNLVQ